MIQSRFAVKEDIFLDEFSTINKRLFDLNKKFKLNDHTEINDQRFPWSKGKFEQPALYISRMWEYPFAILAAELYSGMKCADIGCGTSPFTMYLSELCGTNNVTGFDPDEIKGNSIHSTFGANRTLLNRIGINFKCNSMEVLKAPDESFDRVFCMSVLEHIEEPAIWQKGVKEMVRILKPGGRLIITMDIGINTPLTNPIDIIKYAGLPLSGTLNLQWPKERFLKIDTNAMDVFGLVLEKIDKPVYIDYEKTQEMPQYSANKKLLPDIVNSKQIQIGKDLQRNHGIMRTITKLLLGKYKI